MTRELARLVLRASHVELKRVLALTWPSITQLTVTLARTREPIECARLLDGTAFPNLVELAPALPAGVIERLCTSPLAARLRVLDLREMVIDDRLAKKLVAARPYFVRLERLEVDGTYLSRSVATALRHSMPVT